MHTGAKSGSFMIRQGFLEIYVLRRYATAAIQLAVSIQMNFLTQAKI